jgi:hypothetical protein
MPEALAELQGPGSSLFALQGTNSLPWFAALCGGSLKKSKKTIRLSASSCSVPRPAEPEKNLHSLAGAYPRLEGCYDRILRCMHVIWKRSMSFPAYFYGAHPTFLRWHFSLSVCAAMQLYSIILNAMLI